MKYVLFLALSILASACSQSNHNHENDALNLNEGKRWLVNEEMKPHIIRAEQVLNDFLAKADTDYQTLAKRLKDQNKKLISSCTMKGESHDELHKWLHPHMTLIEKLDEAETPAGAKSVALELAASFQTYHRFFE
jgi:hypothetical protein